jgi:DNA-binding transcriptional LysR family regulator
MIDRLRALLIVIEEGSVNRAAVRLRITQPALSRQIKLLESEVGGRLLDRESSGVKPTGQGHAVVNAMRPVIQAYDAALEDVLRQARSAGQGPGAELRVGFLISAAPHILTPAMERLRQAHPDLRLKLFDMSPKEQIAALRAGKLDVALIGQEGAVAARDFHCHKLCSVGVCVALSSADPLAGRESVAIQDLLGRDFVGVDDDQVPGRNAWITGLCRTAGFKPRFVSIKDGITHVLSTVASESAVTLLPAYFTSSSHPGVSFVPVSDAKARWDLIVLRQRGKAPAGALLFVEALKASALDFLKRG